MSQLFTYQNYAAESDYCCKTNKTKVADKTPNQLLSMNKHMWVI